MKASSLATWTTLALTATCTAAMAQAPNLTGRVYTFHSGPQGKCPGLDWHIVADGDKLSGMISWDNMKHMAKVDGTLNSSAKTFQMTAHEVGGSNRVAQVNGTLNSEGLMIANISGPVNCKQVTIPWFTPPPVSQ